MIIFYPTPEICTPVVITDMTDSSDRWNTADILKYAYLNTPDSVVYVDPPAIFSCKYNYSAQHNGVPLGAALKMTLDAAIFSPPSDLIAQVSVDYVSSAESIDQMSDTLVKFANPEFKIMTAVIVERISATSVISRSFVAYSVVLQPDAYGTNATLFIKGASFDDSLIKAELGFQLDVNKPLNTQLSKLATKLGYTCAFDSGVATGMPVSGRLFQPSTLPKILDEICLQNKLIYKIANKIITFYAQNKISAGPSSKSFSFLGYLGNLIWGVGVENYANVKFKTPFFDANLFDKITIYNDSQSALFQGFKKATDRLGKTIPESYDIYILRYVIERNDTEICCEMTATNNWLLAQVRIDGILESKIFGATS